MNLLETIENDLNKALKERNELVLSTLRLLRSSLKNAQIAKGQELSDEEIIAIVQREIKQRKDASEQFQKANRPELAQKELSEATVLMKYMPEQLSEEELKKIIKQAIEKTNANSPQDMGKVMGQIMPQVKGKADGNKVSQLVKEELSNE